MFPTTPYNTTRYYSDNRFISPKALTPNKNDLQRHNMIFPDNMIVMSPFLSRFEKILYYCLFGKYFKIRHDPNPKQKQSFFEPINEFFVNPEVDIFSTPTFSSFKHSQPISKKKQQSDGIYSTQLFISS